MKKIVAVFMLVSLLLTGCSAGSGETAVTDLSAEEMAQRIADALSISESTVTLPESRQGDYYVLPEGKVEEICARINESGALADEVLVVKFSDEQTAKTAGETLVNSRIEEVKARFQDYIPEEMPKIEGYYSEIRGNYLVFVVAEDTAPAKTAFEECFN